MRMRMGHHAVQSCPIQDEPDVRAIVVTWESLSLRPRKDEKLMSISTVTLALRQRSVKTTVDNLYNIASRNQTPNKTLLLFKLSKDEIMTNETVSVRLLFQLRDDPSEPLSRIKPTIVRPMGSVLLAD
jgi:hypothetical protein